MAAPCPGPGPTGLSTWGRFFQGHTLRVRQNARLHHAGGSSEIPPSSTLLPRGPPQLQGWHRTGTRRRREQNLPSSTASLLAQRPHSACAALVSPPAASQPGSPSPWPCPWPAGPAQVCACTWTPELSTKPKPTRLCHPCWWLSQDELAPASLAGNRVLRQPNARADEPPCQVTRAELLGPICFPV